MNKLEIQNKKDIIDGSLDTYPNLYPNMNDPLFNVKIYGKKEFNDLKYESLKDKDITTYVDELIKQPFELSPHQQFIRNFLSYLTPYNSALLYHGLGSGKTCSAIQVCEEARQYMKQIGIKKKIFIIASPNVQTNFKIQLFDERKLKKIGQNWDMKSCTSNTFLKEINPTNMKGLTKEKIVKQVKKLIQQYYEFMGYIEFSNYVERKLKKYTIDKEDFGDATNTQKEEMKRKEQLLKIRAIQNEFSNSLLVIDEVHNIRSGGESKTKKLGIHLVNVVKYSENLKLLLMSATPMFNTYKEIIWLINLMNLNDGSSIISVKDVFDKNGNFKIKDGKQVGKELFIRKINGYISFVNGENPYTFPFRIYPYYFSETHSLLKLIENNEEYYPERQLNGKRILQGMEYIDLFINSIGKYQKYGYLYAIQELQEQLPSLEQLEQGESGMGWQMVEDPLSTLNFVFPNETLDRWIETRDRAIKINVKELVGSMGIKQVMEYNTSKKTEYKYKKRTLDTYGRIFSEKHIGTYSNKLNYFIQNVKHSNGIVLIYSQYIEGGCVPIGLALEELGFQRYKSGGGKNLFKSDVLSDVEPLDAKTMKPKSQVPSNEFSQASYIMITGDSRLSPHNDREVKASTDEENKYGEKVKVIIISKAGSEGIDFNNIRQVHILEPWYNMSRLEQIIGRGVRFLSHKLLPFSERNVEIFLYGTKIQDKEVETNEEKLILRDESQVLEFKNETNLNTSEKMLLLSEPIDLYVYRQAEKKAVIIGNISRIMKEHAIDCRLNKNINNLSSEYLDKRVTIRVSSNKEIDFKVGYKPFSHICDYKESCSYYCKPEIPETIKKQGIHTDTQNKHFIENNIHQIISIIQKLFREHFALEKTFIIQTLNKVRNHTVLEIEYALDKLVNDSTYVLVDMFGRIGSCVNINEYYLFQPIETTNKYLSYEERSKPIQFTFDELEVQNVETSQKELQKYRKELLSKTKMNETLVSKRKDRKTIDLDIVKEEGEEDEESKEREEEDEERKEQLLKTIQKQNNKIEKFVDIFVSICINYLFTLSVKDDSDIKRGDNNWYKHASITIQRLTEKNFFERELLLKFVIHHAFDTLPSKDKKIIVSIVLDENGDHTIETILKFENWDTSKLKKIREYRIHLHHVLKTIYEYIQQEIHIYNEESDLHGVFLIENSKLKLFTLSNKYELKEATSLDVEDFKKDLIKKVYKIGSINESIGFMMYIKDSDTNVFKVKDIKLKRNIGARCDQAGKVSTLKMMNKIVQSETYTKENTKKNKVIQLCSEEEFLLRGFDRVKKDDKKWFFNYENAMLNNVEKIYKP